MATWWREEAELEQLGRNVIEHPFWARWAGGELAIEQIALFASEYDHVATAIATAARRAARLDPRLAARAEREERHLGCWRRFSRALGWGGLAAPIYAEEPLPETEECADVLVGDRFRSVEEHLLTLREADAVECAVGEVMLNGLLRHYGFDPGPATEYLSLHAELGVEASAGAGGEVEGAYWRMLDALDALGAGSRL